MSLGAGQQITIGPGGATGPAGAPPEPLLQVASRGFEDLSVPPPWRPDEDDVQAALPPAPRSLFELVTTSAAAGGAAFTDPRIAAIEVTVVQSSAKFPD